LQAIEGGLLAWDEERVGFLVTAQGQATHAMIGVAETDWVWLDGELKAVVPPLTAILNRYDATRAAAAAGDELALAVGAFGYVLRSYTERRTELRRRAEQPEVPITGRYPDEPPDLEDEPMDPTPGIPGFRPINPHARGHAR
jgi:hypothetical protein